MVEGVAYPVLKQTPFPSRQQLNRLVDALAPHLQSTMTRKEVLKRVREFFRKRREYMNSRIDTACHYHFSSGEPSLSPPATPANEAEEARQQRSESTRPGPPAAKGSKRSPFENEEAVKTAIALVETNDALVDSISQRAQVDIEDVTEARIFVRTRVRTNLDSLPLLVHICVRVCMSVDKDLYHEAARRLKDLQGRQQ